MCFVVFLVFFSFFSLEQHLTAKKWEGRWGTGGGVPYMYMYIYMYLYVCMYVNIKYMVFMWRQRDMDFTPQCVACQCDLLLEELRPQHDVNRKDLQSCPDKQETLQSAGKLSAAYLLTASLQESTSES